MSKPKLEYIPIGQLQPSPNNPRIITKGDPKLAELAESIRAVGVLEPILVRPINNHFEVIAGERRRLACLMAGLDDVPAIVRTMTDAEALEATVTENLQRADLLPLEEARGIQTLLTAGWTLDQASAQLGKSRAFVARRAQLMCLSKEWQALTVDPKCAVKDWPIACLELVARFPESAQTKLAKNRWLVGHIKSVEELRMELRRELMTLSRVLWKLDDAVLVAKAGPCETCPKRSDRQPELFEPEELPAKKGAVGILCLDAECYASKQAAFVRGKEAELKKAHPDLGRISQSYGTKGAIREYQITQCKKDEKGAKPYLWIDGPKAGKIVWGKKHSSGSSGGGRPKAEKKDRAGRLAELERIRYGFVESYLMDLVEEWGSKCKRFPNLSMEVKVAAAITFGACGSEEEDTDPIAEITGVKEPLATLVDDLFLQALDCAFRNVCIPATIAAQRAFCELVGEDYDALWARACAEKPTPTDLIDSSATPEPKELKYSHGHKGQLLPKEEDPTVVLEAAIDPAAYLDGQGRRLFVHDGISNGEAWGTFYRKGQSYKRVRGSKLPMRDNRGQAQRDLDAYAEKHGFTRCCRACGGRQDDGEWSSWSATDRSICMACETKQGKEESDNE